MADTTLPTNDQTQANPDVPSNKKAFIPLGKCTQSDPSSTSMGRSHQSSEAKEVPAIQSDGPYVTLENNPDVMSSLVHNLGVSRSLAFHDVFSIDDPDLLAFVPRPAYALLLVFPVSRTYEQSRMQEDADRPEYTGSGPAEEVMWFKQTIRNACGLIGLLHGVANGEARKFVGG